MAHKKTSIISHYNLFINSPETHARILKPKDFSQNSQAPPTKTKSPSPAFSSSSSSPLPQVSSSAPTSPLLSSFLRRTSPHLTSSPPPTFMQSIKETEPQISTILLKLPSTAKQPQPQSKYKSFQPTASDTRSTESCLYSLLLIKPGATAEDIRQGYKTQALLWHPKNNPTNRLEAEYHFNKAAIAYKILSNDHHRYLYDRDQLPHKLMTGNPAEIFLNFFNGVDPLANKKENIKDSPQTLVTLNCPKRFTRLSSSIALSDRHLFGNSFGGFPKPSTDYSGKQIQIIKRPNHFESIVVSERNDVDGFQSVAAVKKLYKGDVYGIHRTVANGELKTKVEQNGRIIHRRIDRWPAIEDIKEYEFSDSQ